LIVIDVPAQGARVRLLQGVACIALSAICLECFVENDSALRNMRVERQNEKNRRRHTLKYMARRVLRPNCVS